MGKNDDDVKHEVRKLLKLFKGEDHGNLNWYLDVHVTRDDQKQCFSQKAYIYQAVHEHRLEKIRKYESPMSPNFHRELAQHAEDELINDTTYRQLVGELNFLANRARTDISLACGLLSQHLNRPTSFLLKAANRVFGYVLHTSTDSITHIRKPPNSGPPLTVKFFVDADFAGDQLTRKSRTGWVGMVNDCLFAWASQRQQMTSISTAES